MIQLIKNKEQKEIIDVEDSNVTKQQKRENDKMEEEKSAIETTVEDLKEEIKRIREEIDQSKEVINRIIEENKQLKEENQLLITQMKNTYNELIKMQKEQGEHIMQELKGMNQKWETMFVEITSKDKMEPKNNLSKQKNRTNQINQPQDNELDKMTKQNEKTQLIVNYPSDKGEFTKRKDNRIHVTDLPKNLSKPTHFDKDQIKVVIYSIGSF